MNIIKTAAMAVALTAVAGAASASTIGFSTKAKYYSTYSEDSFNFDGAKIVKSGCGAVASGGNCLRLTKGHSFTVLKADGDVFDLSTISFRLLGKGRKDTLSLTVAADGQPGTTFSLGSTGTFASLTKGASYTFDLAFTGVSSIVFSLSGRGKILIDDVNVAYSDQAAPAPVPLPAAGGLLLAGLGGLGALSRRRAKKKAA